MYGDRLLVCDMDGERFFAGWEPHDKSFAEEMPTPVWSETVDGARKTRSLGNMQNIVKMIGGSTQVVSETKARQIETLKWCRMRSAYMQRVQAGEQA